MLMVIMIRQLVSGNKRRFQEDGFDLDLSYINERIIAMGFPAQKLEGVYRNHIDDVFKFLEHKHKDKYKLYNLCSERHYDADRFHGRVANYPFDDHNPPKIEDMNRFCDDVTDWLRQDGDNVVAIHCKAGKGRTGVMICAFLIHAGIAPTAAAALLEYASKRTSDAKGVTIPSQRRYVEYYEKLVTRQIHYKAVSLVPDRISFSPMPNLNGGSYTFFFVIYGQDKGEIFRSDAKKAGKHCFEYAFHSPPLLTGDVKIEFKNRDVLNVRKQTLFSFWFNTFFLRNHESSAGDQSSLSSQSTDTEPNRRDQCHSAIGKSQDDARVTRNGNGLMAAESVSGAERELCQKCDHHNHESDRRREGGDETVTLVLQRHQLDRVHKVKHSKIFPPDFRVEMRLRTCAMPCHRTVTQNHLNDGRSGLAAGSGVRNCSPLLTVTRNGVCPHTSAAYSETESSEDEDEC